MQAIRLDRDPVEANESCAPYGKASMSMLGNGVFCTGTAEMLATILSPCGQRLKCKVD